MKHLLTLLCCFSLALHAEPLLLDKIAVVVNDAIISESQINDEIHLLQRSLQANKQNIPQDNLRQQVIDSLINEELQIQSARKQRITIDNITLNREIERIAQTQGLNTYQLYDQVIAQGQNYFNYREKIRRRLAIQQTFVRLVRSKVQISEQEIIDYLNSDLNKRLNQAEYKLAHIAITVPPEASAEETQVARNTIETIYKNLINGKDFAETAREVSDSSSSLQDGDLGWLNRGSLPTSFMEAILAMDTQSISKAFRTETAFNLLQLQDIRGIEKVTVQQANVRHILIKTSAVRSSDQAFDEISALRKRIEAGEDLGSLAKIYSDDKSSAALSGELGWADPQNYVPAFKKLVEELPLNTPSQAVKTEFGWHIVEVLNRRMVDQTLQRARQQAEFELLTRKSREQEELWISQLRSSAYIDIRNNKSY